jgi:hypothetical protein
MEFDLVLNLFKIRAAKALGRYDPERHQAVFGEVTDDMKDVSLESIFQAGPILDHERTLPVNSLIKNFGRSSNDLTEWVNAGGSPLIATRHCSTKYGSPPILGYLECLMDGERGNGFLHTIKGNGLPLELWRRGTDDEMVASSLLRGLSTGLIKSYRLGKIIPEALFDAFKNPTVEAQLIDLLGGMTFKAGETIYENAECALMTAYVFDRLGLTRLRQAVLESPAFIDNVRADPGFVGHILSAVFQESQHSTLAHARQFLQSSLGVKPTDSVIDHALQQPFDGSPPNYEFVYEAATRRMEFLIEVGALSQVKYWLKAALPRMERFPEIPQPQMADFLAACKIGQNGSVMEDLAVKNHQGLPFLIRIMGAEAFVEAFRKTCERAASLAATPVDGQELYRGRLIGLNVQTLKDHRVLHDTLDCIMDVYPQLWAGAAKAIQNGKPSSVVERQFKNLTQWVGEALTAAPCNERAVAWFKMIETPSAQEIYVASMPPNQAVFRLMSFKQRATQFGQDLGL